jgi:hypothetical protein
MWVRELTLRRNRDMRTPVELPQAFSVRDENEFFPIQHLLARMNPGLMAEPAATGRHVQGGCTVFWGIVYLKGHVPSKQEVDAALRGAGCDFNHHVSFQAQSPWAGASSGGANK